MFFGFCFVSFESLLKAWFYLEFKPGGSVSETLERSGQSGVGVFSNHVRYIVLNTVSVVLCFLSRFQVYNKKPIL